MDLGSPTTDDSPGERADEISNDDATAHADNAADERKRRRRARRLRSLAWGLLLACLAVLTLWAGRRNHGLPSAASIQRAWPLSALLLLAGGAFGVYAGRLKEAGREHGWEFWRDVATAFVAGAVLAFAFNTIANDIEDERQERSERQDNLRFVRETVIATADHPELRTFANIDLAGMNLSGLPLQAANLTRANLTGADLGFAKLAGADLSGATLSGANLGVADLTGAKLIGVDLPRAFLFFSKLTGASLPGADLSHGVLIGADLSEADLSEARLVGANLLKANLQRANLSRADLSKANLNEVSMEAACYSVDTRWPDGFDAVAAGARLVGRPYLCF